MVRHECAEALGSIAKVSFQEYYRIKQICGRLHLMGRAHGWVASRPGSQYSSYVGLESIVPVPMFLGTQPPYATKALLMSLSTWPLHKQWNSSRHWSWC